MRLTAAAPPSAEPDPKAHGTVPETRARRTAALALGAAGLVLAILWLSGGFTLIGAWALEQQRALQTLLAQHIQDIRAGRSGAFWGLMALSAGYGFVHAVGPGHGKFLVTGAALGTTASARRMAGIALAGSIAQALVAIALVYGAFLIFQATARTAVGLEAAVEPIGHLAVALVGAWLISRGLWALRHPTSACGCGHDHGPDPRAAEARSLREAAAIVAAMAARPCAGALIVLVLAWSMDLAAAGAAAVIAMGLGTAAFTAAVAALAVTGRDAALFSAGRGAAGRHVGPALQIGVGAVVVTVAGALLCTTLVA
jgi:nickel/cobalt transporter (NicO) family protein